MFRVIEIISRQYHRLSEYAMFDGLKRYGQRWSRQSEVSKNLLCVVGAPRRYCASTPTRFTESIRLHFFLLHDFDY